MLIDVQFSAGANDWPALRDAVLRAEGEGASATWVLDHFDGTTVQGDRPMLECFTLLGALAAVTSTIVLGPLVANVANRHPAMLALAASSMARLAPGRFILGLGAGAAPGTKWSQEHDRRGVGLGATMEQRHARVATALQVLRDEQVAVPVIIGVNSVELAQLAGRLAGGLNVRNSHPRAGEFISAGREAAGDRPFEISGWSFGTWADRHQAMDRAAALSLDRLVLTDLGPQ